ncbi:MAG: glycosyltransferase family 4 protein [Candidatus Bathyarchaeia archaeon]
MNFKLHKKSTRNVLFIASYAECPRVWKMASVLAERHFKVTILEWDRKAELPAAENASGMCVRRMKLKAPYGSRLILFLPVWWMYASLYLLTHRFEVVQPQNLDNLVVSWMVSHLRRAKISYDIADFYADTYVPGNVTPLRRFVAWLERNLIMSADAAIAVDEARLRQINLPSVKFSVIYNSPPDIYSDFKGKRADKARSNLPFTIFYAGILEKDRGLDMMVEAIRELPNVRLVVAGFGHLEKEFSRLAGRHNNVEFLGRVPYDRVLELTHASDCVIAIYDPTVRNNVFASPNKLFESMLCAKPIIVSDGTAMSEVVRRERCGFVVEYGNVKQLKELILRIKEDRWLLNWCGENGRRAYERDYAWSLMETRYMETLSVFLPQCDA